MILVGKVHVSLYPGCDECNVAELYEMQGISRCEVQDLLSSDSTSRNNLHSALEYLICSTYTHASMDGEDRYLSG